MSDYKLRIDAHALFQLGEQLITDDEQALIELIKNSYDADSPSVRIDVKPDYIPQKSIDPVPADAVGLIEIEDEGVGMSAADIRNGWLMISLSFKRDLKKAGKPFGKFKRFPLGDKGLGRLGTMRLGKCLSVETRTDTTSSGFRITFQWSDCQSGRPLDEVPVQAEKVPPGKKGTIVRIYGLNDREGWQSPSRIPRLTTKLAALISPFESFSNFEISCKVNGTDIDLGRISKKLREAANIHITHRWENDALKIEGKIKLIWFKKKTPGYEQFIAADDGQNFFDHLRQKLKRFNEFGLRHSRAPWYIEFAKTFSAHDLKLIAAEAEGRSDPGPFHGEIDYFDLDESAEAWKKALGRDADYRKIVHELAQIYIYRDNFGIRMPNDWMKLGAAWTSGAGYHSLRPGSTLGYFQISVAGNPTLIEKSDREGFIENSQYMGFRQMAEEIKAFVNQVLNNLGKASSAYLKEKTNYHADEETDSPANFDKTVRELEEVLNSAVKAKEKLSKDEEGRAIELRKVEAAARRMQIDQRAKPDARAAAGEFIKVLDGFRRQLTAEHATILQFIDSLQKQRNLAAIIRKRIDNFTDRAEMFAEMIATGLSAQAAAHDVPSLLAQIDTAARTLMKAAAKNYVEPEEVRKKSEIILGANNGVRELLDLIQPMLRGRRWAGRTAKISELVDEYFKLRGGRLRARNIAWTIEYDPSDDFIVSINQGRLIQVLDNLVTNSEYWIEDHFGKDSNKGRITVEIKKPALIYFDNGPGIRPDLDNSLFEMFVSGKPANKGNGLGLFITRQLLERDGCAISVSPERNRNDRLFKFIVNLSGARSE